MVSPSLGAMTAAYSDESGMLQGRRARYQTTSQIKTSGSTREMEGFAQLTSHSPGRDDPD
jgi:hypothetical protein